MNGRDENQKTLVIFKYVGVGEGRDSMCPVGGVFQGLIFYH